MHQAACLSPLPGLGKILTPIDSHGSRGGLKSFGPPGLGKGSRQKATGSKRKTEGSRQKAKGRQQELAVKAPDRRQKDEV